MAKIKTYPEVTSPALDDLVIGTDVSDDYATKNFTVQDIVNLAAGAGVIPDLQAVLNSGNTATQDVNLTGDITATTVTSPTILSSSLISGNLILATGGFQLGVNGLLTVSGTSGLAGQTLVSNGGLSPSWEYLLLKKVVELTPTQMLNLGTTPVELVPAGAGQQAFEVVACGFDITFNSAGYDFTDPLKVGTYTGGPTEEAQFTVNAGTVNTLASGFFSMNKQTVDNARISPATALSVWCDNPPTTTNGNSTCRFQVMYRIVEAQ